MIRFTLTDAGDLVAHGSLGERDLSPDEVETVRNALPAPRMPTWLDWGVFVAGVVALFVWTRGGGQ